MELLFLYIILTITLSFLCSIFEAVLLSINTTFIKIKLKEGRSYAKSLLELKNSIDEPLIIILTLIVSLKSFYILYSIFLIPVGIFLLNNKKINIQNYLFKNFSVYFFVATIFLVSTNNLKKLIKLINTNFFLSFIK